jgi:signal transduction histidine kinase
VLGAQEHEANQLLVLLAGVALLAVAAGWLLGELSVVRWVAALGRAAEAFGRGELNHRAALPRSAAEFATLGSAFDRMAATLAARRDAVEAANRALAAQTEALRAAKDKAEAASRAKTEFLATMSHELRTPLNAIIGFSDIIDRELMGPIGTPEYREYIADILSSGRHLLSLICDILDFVKADSGSLQLAFDEVDLVGLARSVVRLLLLQSEAAGVALAVEAEDELLVVRGDERRLRQILLNLAGNAVKFTPAGGSVTIALSGAADGAAFIAVRDTGVGIAAADLPRVMQPFQQVDGSFSRKQEGIGLGLAICERLVRLHGGSLELCSELGKGTTATVALPAPPAERAVA